MPPFGKNQGFCHQGTWCFICPGILMLMTPPQAQVSLEESLRAGLLAMSTVGQPGAQGAGITGTQGMGVSTPMAAAVAEATVGLDMEVHMPKGMMFFMGTLSMMVAAGILEVRVLFSGVTTRLEGAMPKEHWHIAPMHT